MNNFSTKSSILDLICSLYKIEQDLKLYYNRENPNDDEYPGNYGHNEQFYKKKCSLAIFSVIFYIVGSSLNDT